MQPSNITKRRYTDLIKSVPGLILPRDGCNKMSGITHKLTALYRLDFYKKKKSWILGTLQVTPKSKNDGDENVHIPTCPEASQEPTSSNEKLPKANEAEATATPPEQPSSTDSVKSRINKLLQAQENLELEEHSPEKLQQMEDQQEVLYSIDDFFNDENGEVDYDSDSYCKFTRGAHKAPHSSEVDLIVPAMWENEIISSSLAHISSRQLASRVAAHACALKRLLKEFEKRNDNKYGHSSQKDVSDDSSSNESKISMDDDFEATLLRGRVLRSLSSQNEICLDCGGNIKDK